MAIRLDGVTIEDKLRAYSDRSGGVDECWPWTRGKDSSGYGVVCVPRVGQRRVHRVSYEAHVGPIPNGAEVLHSCDNPPCINPAHLSTGTHARNMRDMVERDRHSLGTRAHGWKMSDGDVAEAFALRAQGWKMRAIAERFSVTPPQISKLLRGVRGAGRVDSPPFRKRGLAIEQIREIRAERARGIPGRVLADRFGITVNNVYDIAVGKLHGDKR